MRLILFLILSLLLAQPGKAQYVIREQLKENIYLNAGISFLEDPESRLKFEDVKNSLSFKSITTDVPNFGISASTFWLKLEILNLTGYNGFRIEVAQPNLDEIDFYRVDGNTFTARKGGEVLPFAQREFADPNYIYRLPIDSGKTAVVYMRMKSRDNFKVPIMLGSQESMFDSSKTRDFVFGLFGGIMLVMFLYNLFLYLSVRDKTYLYYIIYLAAVILTQVSIQGYTFQYLWPDVPFLACWSPFIWSPMVGVASAVFMREFLSTRQYVPRLDKGFKYFFAAYGLAVILAIAGQFPLSYLLITLDATFLSLYMLIAAVYVQMRGHRSAKYFLLAWSLFLFGVTVYAMTNLSLLPINSFTFYVMPAGAAAEVILLSLALAERINVLKKEKEASQAEALRVSEQNQKLITEQNIVLEQKVHERTLELEDTNQELNKTLSNLKDTQAQLVDAEKMASLGQLTAGIAHEINNPINFVRANVNPLRMDIMDVLEVVNQYETVGTAADVKAKLGEIDELKKRIDLDYIKAEMSTLLNGIEDGAKRTAEIVSGLKNFSRLDESDLKEADINEGIESTLILIRSTIPANIKVVTELGQLPFIECYPGKLNQVLMNLLTNAIYAVKKKDPPGAPQTIHIGTYERYDKIYIEIEDSGIGMTEQVKNRIFEPFYTTKDVGEGTGLGMSIVFKILEIHKAKLEIDTEPGRGTKMTIILNKRITGL